MGLVLPPIEAYQVQHLPIVKAYADKIGLVEAINTVVPTEMEVDPGTIVLGMILDTFSGRSPLYRLEEFFTHQDTVLLLGKMVAPEAFNDDTVGRVLERLYSDIATFLAQHGVAPGAYIYVADAALVTEDNLAALGDTLFITRLPATYNECGRLIAEAVAHNAWEEVGVLAHTKPTKHRPGTSYKAYEGHVTLYGKPYRAVVVHSSAQDKRRQQRLARDIQTSSSTVQTTARTAEQQEYFCRADAEAAAAQLRAVHAAYHRMDVAVEERPVYGRGRPSPHKPRPVKAMRYRLKTTISPQTERIARLEEEAGCFVLLTNVPTTGPLAHSARDILTVYKEQHGTEQNYGFLKGPVIVNSLFLKKPERIEALGLVLLLALLLWWLMERAMRTYVDTPARLCRGGIRK